MDTIPRYEFHRIFRRFSHDVSLKGAFNEEEIRRRSNDAIDDFREMARETIIDSERFRLFSKAKAIENLIDRGFAEATIKEARDNRYGLVGLTLRFGIRKAEEMRQAFENARRRPFA